MATVCLRTGRAEMAVSELAELMGLLGERPALKVVGGEAEGAAGDVPAREAGEMVAMAKPLRLVEDVAAEPVIREWQQERERLGTAPRNAKKQANRLVTLFKERRWGDVRNIERQDVVAAIQAMRDEGLEVKTAETLMSQIRAFYEWAVAEGHANVNPCDGIRRAKVRNRNGPNTRKGMRALYDDEPLRLIEHAGDARGYVYKIALTTGGRKGQLTLEPGSEPIRWRDVDLRARRLIFHDTKNGDNWPIPLCDAAMETFAEWRKKCEVAGPDEFVFPFRIQDREFNADLADAGIPKHGGPSNRSCNFHSLRKTFCTNLVMSGVPVPVAQRLMQHRTLEMTLKVYTEVRDDQLEAGVGAVENFFSVGARSRNERDLTQPPAGAEPPNQGFDLTNDGRIAEDTLVQFTSFHSGHETPGGNPRPGGLHNLPGGAARSPVSRAETAMPSIPTNIEGRSGFAAEHLRGGSGDRPLDARLMAARARLIAMRQAPRNGGGNIHQTPPHEGRAL